MPNELKIPAVGESITEVQIGEWLKSEGDSVKADEPVAVIDSEKTTFELPAPHAGRLSKILHQAGETVPVGTAVALFEPAGDSAQPVKKETAAKPEAKGGKQTKDKTEKPALAEKSAEEKSESSGSEKEKPQAGPEEEPERETAKPESEPDSKGEETKGKTGKPAPAEQSTEEKPEPAEPEKEKPQAAAEETAQEAAKPESELVSKTKTKTPAAESAPGREEEVVPMTMLRRTVARHLVAAQQTMAMLTTFNEADLSAVQALRHEHHDAFEKRHQVKLGLMSFFVKAAIDALKQFPRLNAEVRGDDIVYRNYFDIGVAIASERGLVVPVLRNAERLSFAELEKAVGDFARRAKEGKLKPDELEGGTFTITNGGVFGSLLSTPIINPPQSGIMGMHAIQERPVAAEGQVVIRPMMYLALSYDHRIVDGREAVLFLRRVKAAIESPARMLIEI